MTAYTMTIVIENLDVDDDVLATLADEFSDVSSRTRDGLAFVTATVEGASQKSAGQTFTRGFKSLFPDAILVRLDQDLVSVEEIAGRIDRSTDDVRLLIEGSEGPGGFPAPIGIVADGIRIWPWATVAKWLTEQMNMEFAVTLLDPEASAAVDANLASRRLIGPDHSKGGL